MACRYGESLHELIAGGPAGEAGGGGAGLASWHCPHCRGICNAGACRLRQGLCHVNHTQAVAAGFKSVAHWIITSNQRKHTEQAGAPGQPPSSEMQEHEASPQQQGPQQGPQQAQAAAGAEAVAAGSRRSKAVSQVQLKPAGLGMSAVGGVHTRRQLVLQGHVTRTVARQLLKDYK